MDLPPLYRIRQRFDVTTVADVAAAVRDEFSKFDWRDKIRPGQSVAVGVGSRGTHDLRVLAASTVACLKSRGLKPFVIPAMGSHGGGTAEGQAQVLAELGITRETVGAPIVSSMDVASLGRSDSGAEVYFAKDALDADHIVVINRVKPHTAFRAEVESGLCKILAVGCGRQKGAANMHRYELGKTIVPAARLIMQQASVLCGLAVTENALGGIHSLKLAKPEEFPALDSEFLKTAWTLLPKLPVEDLDILLVDEMGKNVSGAGMDPNVIGFWRREGGPRRPDYRILIVLDLTPHSHGNATGIGMADLTTRRVVDRIDWEATYLNAFTSGVLRSARMPIPVENDKLAVETALYRTPNPGGIRMVRIVNTGELESFWATAAVASELKAQKNITVDDVACELKFSHDGRLLSMID
ncbi:Iron-sulfur cluster-binding protein [Olavius sp. associated proteobacterium Delta 1]|nr:Iron-sulfur cluster-binding protein [Olavius sp. associated proteobacterium Delta 1]CAD7842761.1 MAG: Iron-sulfur cluster-binding protein [Olavius algarvensis spirochete endosymbiont]